MDNSVIFMLIVSAISLTFGTAPYIISTIQGKTKPNRISWFLWGVIPMIAVGGLIQEGITWGAYTVFMAGLIPFVIFGVSFINPQAYWKLGKLDYYCGALTVVTIIFWMLTNNALLVITLSIVADIFAGLPIIKKAYEYPETESPWLFLTASFTNATSFLVMERYDTSEIAFNLYLVVFNLTLVFLLRKNIQETASLLYNRYIKT